MWTARIPNDRTRGPVMADARYIPGRVT